MHSLILSVLGKRIKLQYDTTDNGIVHYFMFSVTPAILVYVKYTVRYRYGTVPYKHLKHLNVPIVTLINRIELQ
jgi:hypothetical protein